MIENTWADAQAGFAFVLKSENQNGDTPWTQTTDVTIRYNKIRNVGSVFNIAANPSGTPAIPAARFVITDNVIENVNAGPYIGEGRTFQLLSGLSDVVVMHNTMVSANGDGPASVYFDAAAITRLVMHSNILHHGNVRREGRRHDGGHRFPRQVLAGLPVHQQRDGRRRHGCGLSGEQLLPGARSPTSASSNLSGGDYRLSTSSTYLNKGYDGRDIGADINTVNSKTTNVVVGRKTTRCTSFNDMGRRSIRSAPHVAFSVRAAFRLFAVRNPDVLHLRRLAQELAPLALARIGPRARRRLAPGALHVPRRRELHRLHAVARAEIPHRVHVVVLGERLRERSPSRR